MKLKTSFKAVITEVICLLFVLLFVYAAVSKLLDFENFQIQLGQSPLLSAFASWISWMVPITELIIATLLLLPRYKGLGLFGAYSLMIMFTVYIFIVLHYSSFVPCSCGGILEKMSWNIHLVFNFVFVIFAGLAIIFQNEFLGKRRINKIYTASFKSMVVSLFFSTAVMVVLFLSSEEIMHHDNPFLRRYPKHPAMLINQKDLKFNSYYFAGYNNGKLYMGNYTNPLRLLLFDSLLKKQQTIKIIFDPKNIPFQSVTVSVKASYFYLKDGRVPAVFRGNTRDWKINREFKGIPYFTYAETMDSTTIVFRSNNGTDSANILGIFNTDKRQKVNYNGLLLQKQIDGIFDTDGILMYSEKINKIVYLYFYRNEFIIADGSGRLDYRGHTIDTISKAQIKVAYLKNGTERTMSAPPLVVNASAAVCEGLLFIHSTIKGRYENDKLWKQASIIDVYDLNRKVYLLSFPIYNIDNDKLKTFIVTPTHLYALIGNNLAVYELKTIIKKELKSVGTTDI